RHYYFHSFPTRRSSDLVMLPNIPAMVEAHFGIPMLGAVLNTLNTRLDPKAIAYMLDHGEASAVIVDTEFSTVMQAALALRQNKKDRKSTRLNSSHVSTS